MVTCVSQLRGTSWEYVSEEGSREAEETKENAVVPQEEKENQPTVQEQRCEAEDIETAGGHRGAPAEVMSPAPTCAAGSRRSQDGGVGMSPCGHHKLGKVLAEVCSWRYGHLSRRWRGLSGAGQGWGDVDDNEDGCVEGSHVRHERNVARDIGAAAARGGMTACRCDVVVAGSLRKNRRVVDDEECLSFFREDCTVPSVLFPSSLSTQCAEHEEGNNTDSLSE